MIAYVTVGADNIARAKRFYSAFLPALDYSLEERSDGLSYTLPDLPGQSAALPDFYVNPTFDGSYCQIWCLSGAGHAAIWLVLASIPSLNLTPVMTLAR
jgi:catechol 2,3-dioxygenase-like lactoylglutathione lyase family enzyme